jgi:hypothetical protein
MKQVPLAQTVVTTNLFSHMEEAVGGRVVSDHLTMPASPADQVCGALLAVELHAEQRSILPAFRLRFLSKNKKTLYAQFQKSFASNCNI